MKKSANRAKAVEHAVLAISEENAEKIADFKPGITSIPVSGKKLHPSDFELLIHASIDGWLTEGAYTDEFEKLLRTYVGVRNCSFVNSGSSANLAAISALTSYKLGPRALTAGDEVITPASGFPTTVNPIIQNQLVPVLVDVELGTYLPKIESIEQALTEKTKAVVLAHPLGNTTGAKKLAEFCKENKLWLVEDSCDALGGSEFGQKAGSFGDISTLSFYPAHHITTGEGGAVLSKSPLVKKVIESFRDWGRDCYCVPGVDNTCKKRYQWQLGELPMGYDHKYTYSHVGYNLKATDLQAAIGIPQVDRIDEIKEKRQRNFSIIYDYVKSREDFFILPEWGEGADISWFGFPLTIRQSGSSKRGELLSELNSRQIGTRLLFGGNLARQPAYLKQGLKIHKDLNNSDKVMNDTFWVGTFPGITDEMAAYIGETLTDFEKKL